MKRNIILSINEFLNDISFFRKENGVVAKRNNEIVGELSLYNYWTEKDYIKDEKILKNINIPQDYEFIGMIESYEENKGIATNMLKYALETSNKKGIAISKLFIADDAIHKIMKKLNAVSLPDWYILNK